MITFNGKEYKTRTFRVFYEDHETVLTIADESLWRAMTVNDEYFENPTPEAEAVDQQIYFYVEEGCLELSAEEICKDCLDIPMKFLEEII